MIDPEKSPEYPEDKPTLPPPKDPSPELVYFADMLMKRIAGMEARTGRRIEAIEKHLAAKDLDSKGEQEQIKSFGGRINEVERTVRALESRVDDLEAEEIHLNGEAP